MRLTYLVKLVILDVQVCPKVQSLKPHCQILSWMMPHFHFEIAVQSIVVARGD